ncbi:prepilin peptidase [Marinicrinis sediminis]|uniref:Prepilin peptidase n=1 Tax=Marinicrinis sediminis TaxID=1652465 RepID=A0ABW5RD51_9BACL
MHPAELVIWLLVFLLGASVSSFLNVVAYRLPKGESFVYPSSHCPHCQRPLRPLDLIPVASWLWNRGQCRYCKARIHLRYLLVEIIGGAGFVWIYNEIDGAGSLILAVSLFCILLTVTLTDLSYRLIPNRILYPAYVYFYILMLLFSERTWWEPLAGFLFGGGVLLAVAMIAERFYAQAMGGGDIKLMALVGLVLGIKQTLLCLFFSSLLGAVIGLVLIALRILKRQEGLPYGPFISLAAWIIFLYGQAIMQGYMQLYV